jgi:protein-lysine N-methyltransferase EEF2KMT
MSTALRLFRQCAPVASVLDAWTTHEHPAPWWAGEAAQDAFCADVLGDALAAQYPLRKGYARALAKRYIDAVEREGGAVSEALTLWYVEALQAEKAVGSACGPALDRGDTTWSHQVFSVPVVGADPPREETIVLRVAPQFSNVGLALWPSAFILCEFLGTQHAMLTARVGGAPWRVLELGAGVSLTAIYIAKCLLGALAAPPACIAITDYMDNILDNARTCIALNGCAGAPQEVAVLDWTARDANAARIAQWCPNLVLGADVIYDADVLDDLAYTLRQCFVVNPRAVCVLVATRRNEATSGKFFAAVAPFATVEDVSHLLGEKFTISSAGCDGCAGAVVGPYFVPMLQLTQVFLISYKGN